jgi:hypothetical protein
VVNIGRGYGIHLLNIIERREIDVSSPAHRYLSGMYTKTVIPRLKAGDTFLNVGEGIFDTLRKSAEWGAQKRLR